MKGAILNISNVFIIALLVDVRHGRSKNHAVTTEIVAIIDHDRESDVQKSHIRQVKIANNDAIDIVTRSIRLNFAGRKAFFGAGALPFSVTFSLIR